MIIEALIILNSIIGGIIIFYLTLRNEAFKNNLKGLQGGNRIIRYLYYANYAVISLILPISYLLIGMYFITLGREKK